MVSSAYGNDLPIPNRDASSPPTDKAADKPYPWIISPVVDFIFIYGGAFWLLFFTHVLLFGWNAADPPNLTLKGGPVCDYAITGFFGILAVTTPVLLSNAHTCATYLRIYANKESREEFKFYGKYLIIAPPLLLALALIFPQLQGWIIYIHMGWVFQHYTSQTYGISLIYCYKNGYFMNEKEKAIFKRLQLSIALYVITMLLCIKENVTTNMWGVKIPFVGLPREIHYVAIGFCGIMTLLFIGSIIGKYRREKKMIPMPVLLMVIGVGFIGMSTGYASTILWLWGTPFLHGAQYCLVSLSYYIKERGLPAGMKTSQIAKLLLTKPALRWMGLALLGGCFIYIVIPQILADNGWDFMAMVSVITGCVNFHHFLTDAAIWRMRDPKIKKLLIS
ncbi:MAG: hypothetical protein K2X93_08510 [Candidatus Obscuribacterales bacterium]|nr:hypothetical protein [Candidatus Obscuribacterales bacterium]